MIKPIGFVLLFIVPTAILAATSAGAAFENGLSARAYALGQSTVAQVNDSSAVFWNPAGLARVHGDIGVLRYRAFETDTTAIQTAIKFGNIGIGAGYIRASMGDIIRSTRSSGRGIQTGDTFSYGASGYYIGGGITISDISIGLSTKFLTQQLDSNTASGFGADVGIQMPITDWCNAGILAQNIIPPQLKWDTESNAIDQIPFRLMPALSLNVTHELTVYTQAAMESNASTTLQWGIEYTPISGVAFRAGHNQREFSIGTGIQLSPIALDFTWSSTLVDGLDDTYRIGTSYLL